MLYAAPKQTWEQLKAQWKGNAWVGPGALDVDTSHNAKRLREEHWTTYCPLTLECDSCLARAAIANACRDG